MNQNRTVIQFLNSNHNPLHHPHILKNEKEKGKIKTNKLRERENNIKERNNERINERKRRKKILCFSSSTIACSYSSSCI